MDVNLIAPDLINSLQRRRLALFRLALCQLKLPAYLEAIVRRTYHLFALRVAIQVF